METPATAPDTAPLPQLPPCHAATMPGDRRVARPRCTACMAMAASCLAIAMISCTLATCPGSASAPNTAFATPPIVGKSRVRAASLMCCCPSSTASWKPRLTSAKQRAHTVVSSFGPPMSRLHLGHKMCVPEPPEPTDE